jgi:hypothetical protein
MEFFFSGNLFPHINKNKKNIYKFHKKIYKKKKFFRIDFSF